MPIYQFECQGCGRRFEDLVPHSRRDAVTCPGCGGKSRVLVSATAAYSSGGSSGSAPSGSRFT